MRERSILWDLLAIALLFLLVLISGITLLQNNNLEKSNRLNAKALDETLRLLHDIQSKGISVSSENQSATSVKNSANETGSNVAHLKKSYNDGSKNPIFKRGDENADDGDALVINELSEPNSLNPLIDNDATGHDLFMLCSDYLAERAFDDLQTWQPKLARAWDKAMVCRGIAANKNARELAAKLNSGLSAAEKDKFQIASISAESDEILRIDLQDAVGDYREPVLRLLGDGALARQFWLYVSFEGDTFSDGSVIDAKSVGKLVRDAIQSAPDFKGYFLPDWEREGSVVIRAIGNGDAAEKALRALIDSPKNMGQVADPKSTTGKVSKKVLTFDLREKYDFEEQPIFTFYLREGVKWHDGEAFSGKDVVFSYNAMMNPKVECSSMRNSYIDCEKCELVDGNPMLVRFTWKKPNFTAFNASCEMYLFPEHVFKFKDAAEFNKSPKNQWIIGTGPYKLQRWDRKQQMTFVRNENYWGRKPHLDKINALFVDDPTVSMQMLEAGNLDIHGMTKSQAKLKLIDKAFTDKFGTEVSIANQFSYLGWNLRRPIFSSLKTRQALTMLTDRKRIVDTILRGYGLVLDVPTHPQSPVYPKNAAALHIPFDIAAAKKLLAEDGWADTDGDNVLDKLIDGKRVPFKFTLLIASGSPDMESIANLIKDTYAQAGIQVTISNLEWSVMLQNIERLNFDAAIGGWRIGLDDDPYQLFHSSQIIEKASNHCGYVNKEVDRLIEEGRRELNETKRNAMFSRVYEIIARDLPYTTLFVPKRTVAYDKRIQNVVYNLKGKDITRWWVPKEKQKRK